MNPESRQFLAKLRRLLDRSFNLAEIQLICFDLGIDFEHLAGETKPLKIHQLILHLARHGQVDELLELLADERPDITWPAPPAEIDLDSDGEGEDMGSGIKIGDVGANAAVAVGPGASVNVQNTQVQNYAFSGSISGDVNIAGDVHVDASDLPIPDPPPTELPPGIEGFVGREDELARFHEQLRTSHMAVISGMPGMGKTRLAAVLAQQAARPENIFWHTFRRGQGVESVVWQLAAFAAHRGQDDLWQLLQRARLTRGNPPPVETLLNYLVQMLRGRGYLLVLDDIHIIDDDPQLNLFVERSRRALLAGEIDLILTSRRLPEFVTLVETAYIPGLSLAATRQLLQRQQINLPAELEKRLFERTQGNAELLTLSIEMLREAKEPDRLLDHLSEAENVERFLLSEIDAKLEDQEPEVMSAVAVLNLLGHPGTRYAIAAILEGQNVRRVLRDLVDRFLLLVERGEKGEGFGQHAIVREFYYDALNRRQRQALHRLAGAYYAEDEPDPLRAATHFLEAGEAARAAELAVGDIWEFINTGRSRELREILLRLQTADLGEDDRLQVQMALGDIHAFFGSSAEARACYEAALAAVDGRPLTEESRRQKIRLYRGMGELLAQEDPQAAIDWLQRGIEQIGQLAAADVLEEAGLYVKLGAIYNWLGDFEKAEPALAHSLDILPLGPSQLRTRALVTLGAVVLNRDFDVERANRLTEEALSISEQMRDYFEMSGILSNRGGVRFEIGAWPVAVQDFQDGLALAERVGSDKMRLVGELNLGTAFIYQGREAEAQAHLATALELARATAQRHLECMALLNLAELRIRQEQWEEAAALLDQAAPLNEQLQDEYNVPILLQGRAQINLARSRLDEALQQAQQAAEKAGEAAGPLERGIALRIVGQVLTAAGRHEEALKTLQESRAALDGSSPFEIARTRLQQGRTLLAAGQKNEAAPILEEARATFERLGARSELQWLALQLEALNTTRGG